MFSFAAAQVALKYTIPGYENQREFAAG